MIIIDALKEGILALGVEAVLAPQAADMSGPRVELYLSGLSIAGESEGSGNARNFETLKFRALIKSSGTHETWLEDTILFARKFAHLEIEPMILTTSKDGEAWLLRAAWQRLQEGQFEYPGEEEGTSMPVTYVEIWQVEISYQSRLID